MTEAGITDYVERARQLGFELEAAAEEIETCRELLEPILDALVESKPFERRFRDVHTVIQQYQGRQAHFEDVGQLLAGLQTETTMFTF